MWGFRPFNFLSLNCFRFYQSFQTLEKEKHPENTKALRETRSASESKITEQGMLSFKGYFFLLDSAVPYSIFIIVPPSLGWPLVQPPNGRSAHGTGSS